MRIFKSIAASIVMIVLSGSALLAAEIGAARKTVETDFMKAADGKASFLACLVMPQNPAFEVCSFQAGEAIAIAFMFDANTKAYRATSVIFPAQETDLAITMGKVALRVSNYAGYDSLDFQDLIRQATLTGKEVPLSKGVAATTRKTPPSLHLLVFGPVAP